MTSSNYEYHIEEKKIVKFIAKHLRSVDVFENLIILLPNTFSYQSIIKIIEIEDKVF